MVITTAQLHSSKPELRFCAGSNPARGVSEIRDGEDLWQWSRLEIRLNAFRRSTIPQKQFINSFAYYFKLGVMKCAQLYRNLPRLVLPCAYDWLRFGGWGEWPYENRERLINFKWDNVFPSRPKCGLIPWDWRILWSSLSRDGINHSFRFLPKRKSPRKRNSWAYYFSFCVTSLVQTYLNLPWISLVW